ncbi:Release factor glutamine methyltransferase [Candidatus Promineifilum breve]|uniref:Release factor glutamine methyltransferase n=1 Tax=Candidatus Promineifilum breve TaxID=1806508 RepID=A0A170PIQ8_9CHLR|nr:peptide chain release factor N(5)-glutamine methyltransferase [Candidatus Promineifilum breve]CUS04987.2 Release factor glutamine methyltransferase [Candidatus Promineifilum breve]
MTTIREARQTGRASLRQSPTPALDARLLLEHALGRDHAYLIAHDDEALTAEALAEYERALARAAAGEPIPYLTGHAPFMGLDFLVSSNVLIPRPETEQLVEMAIEWAEGRGAIRIVDVGTGSGCIAVSLARTLPAAHLLAVDISAAALAVAAANVARHVPGRVQLVRGDLLTAIGPGLDLITANLPYVAGPEWPTLPIGVKSYEPALALDGGADGLDLIRALLPQAAARLRPEGLALLEIGWQQGQAVTELAQAAFPAAEVSVQQDFAGHDRIVVIKLAG